MNAGTGYLVEAARSACVIVRSAEAVPLEILAAEELQRYIQRLTGVAVPIAEWTPKANRPSTGNRILVGSAERLPGVAQALKRPDEVSALRAGGYLIRRAEGTQGCDLVLSGREPIATLYAVYHLLEMLGATFLLSGDLLPPPVSSLEMPKVDQAFEPVMEQRGLLPCLVDLTTGILGLADYQKLIDQMVKLRLNSLVFFGTACEPWVEFSYRGEKALYGDVTSRESGYLVVRVNTHDPHTDLVRIGKERFGARKLMASPELQGVQTQEEAHDIFKRMIKGVFAYAKARGLRVGLGTSALYVPPNLARFTRPFGQRPYNVAYGATGLPTDPVFMEIAELRLKALVETYPEIDEFMVFHSETPETVKDPETLRQVAALRPAFEPAVKTLTEQWESKWRKHRLSPEEYLASDLAMLQAARQLVAKVSALRKDLRVSLAFLFRGYLLPSVDQVIDKSIPLADFQSSGVFALKSDVNAQYFAGMGERPRTIIARVDDDGSMFGLPFYLRQFERDGLFKKAVESGVTGMLGQVMRLRGTEHHARFLAQGAWTPDQTPDEFYRRFAHEVFGDAAPFMVQAFDSLETMEAHLGWRGAMNFSWCDGSVDLRQVLRMVCGPRNQFAGPDDPEVAAKLGRTRSDLFARAVALADAAIEQMCLARHAVCAKGRDHLAYLLSRTQAYRAHLEMCATVNEGLFAYARAFADHRDESLLLRAALTEAESFFARTVALAQQAAEIAAESSGHPSDLAILFHLNTRTLADSDRLLRAVRGIVNYHHGRPYWPETAELGRGNSLEPGWGSVLSWG